jgi:homoserine kinase
VTTASAPASSANLGPGFDVAALALDLRCTVHVSPAGEWTVTTAGEPAPETTVRMLRSVAGDRGPFAVDIESQIPSTRGLGSSAALLVAAAAAMADDGDADTAFTAALAVEGHPDNVAAAAHGGLVLVGPDGTIHRGAVHPSLHVVVAVPHEELSTTEARRVLPEVVDRDVAVRTVARMAVLVEGLRTGDVAALRAALGDELHQRPRGTLTDLPGSLIEAAIGSGAAFAAWSGAGPSVVTLVTEDSLDDVTAALDFVLDGDGATLELEIDREGVRLE